MSVRTTPAHDPFALDDEARAELRARCERAVRRARRGGGEVLVGLTVAVDPAVDPSAVVFASRRAGEDWFCFEQPDRGGAALAALGAVRRFEASGPGRFGDVAAAWRELAGSAVAGTPAGPAGAGLVAVGGFAFAPDGGAAPHWAGYGSGELVVPEVALARRDGEVRLTLAALAAPDDVPEELADRIAARAAELRERPLPLLDPAPAGPLPDRERGAARALRGGRRPRRRAHPRRRAREDRARPRGRRPRARAARRGRRLRGPARRLRLLLRLLRRPRRRAFVAASPELLVRREGLRTSTVALAGSIRRSADPAVDDHLGEQLLRSAKDREEQAIVARRIARALRPHAVWVAAPTSRRSSRSPTSSTSRRRSAPSSRARSASSSWPACCTRRRPSAASRTTRRRR